MAKSGNDWEIVELVFLLVIPLVFGATNFLDSSGVDFTPAPSGIVSLMFEPEYIYPSSA